MTMITAIMITMTMTMSLIDGETLYLEMLRVGPHQSVELSKLSGPEEDLRHPELEVVVVQSESFKQSFAEEPGVEPGEVWREDGLVHAVEVTEGSSAGEALLHQLQHAGHPGTLELGEDAAAVEHVLHHLDVGLDAPDEVGPGGPELLHQLPQLGLELAAHADEVELAPVLRSGGRLEQLLYELVLALQSHHLQRGVQGVVVLLYEVLGGVANSSGKVTDQEPVLVTDLSVLLQLGLSR